MSPTQSSIGTLSQTAPIKVFNLRVVALCLISFSVSACHLVSSPETLFGESGISDLSERNESSSQADLTLCQRGLSSRSEGLSSFTSWWEGQWRLDHERLTAQLAEQMESAPSDPNIKAISASLSTAFSLSIHAQQATLSIDGHEQRLATSPLQKSRGVRLIGGQRELSLWCEGENVFWRAESGESFPIRQAD